MTARKPAQAVKAPVRSLDTFGVTHVKAVRLPQQIKAALAEMAKLGAEWYEYEADFRKRIKAAPKDLARIRAQFSSYVVEIPRANRDGQTVAWFATPAAATKARRMLKASHEQFDTSQTA